VEKEGERPPEAETTWRRIRIAALVVAAASALTAFLVVGLLRPDGLTREERLHSALVSTEPGDPRLPDGYRLAGVRPGTDVGEVESKLGEAIFELDGPDMFNGVRYEIFRADDPARQRFDQRANDLVRYSPQTGATLFGLGDYPMPSLCVDDPLIGTECFVLVGHVIVQASAANDPLVTKMGLRNHAVLLIQAAVDHLETLDRDLQP
jgi:hypothetical protein